MTGDVSVILDSREPMSVASVVAEHPSVSSLEIDELEAGDLSIRGIGFERKTVSDYITSLTEGRLTRQSRKLGQKYDCAYLLVEGDLIGTEEPYKSSIEGSSLRGSMASMTARKDSGVRSVVLCSNTELLVDMATRLARKHTEDSSTTFLDTGEVDISEPTTKRMFGCIDGVGPDTAENCMTRILQCLNFCELRPSITSQRLMELERRRRGI